MSLCKIISWPLIGQNLVTSTGVVQQGRLVGHCEVDELDKGNTSAAARKKRQIMEG